MALAAGLLPAQAVLVGVSPSGAQRAYLSGSQGLYVTGWPAVSSGELRLGLGSEPRFDAHGNLYFTRTVDDGRVITKRTTWMVPAGSVRPRPLAAGATAPPYRLPNPPTTLSAVIKVAIDAGHGGSAPGAVGNGLREKDINLDVVNRLKVLLDADTADTRGGGEWNVLVTRPRDVTVSLRARTNMANAFAAKTFLSVHMNGSTSASAHGSETYAYLNQQNRPGGFYRNRLHRELIAAWGLRDRGVKTANFHVLRETRMPAALVEGGFISNAGDARKMGDATARQRLALGLLWATQEFHGLRRYTPGTGSGHGTLQGVVYDASQGTGARITGAIVSLSSGTFVTSSNSTASFAFSLAPGTYRYAASAPGYEPAWLSRTVTANKTIWGSLGLRPVNAPWFFGPARPTAGSTFTMTLRGDPGSPAFLLIGGRPGIPLLTFSTAGRLWPDLRGSLSVRLANIPSSGMLSMRFATPRQPGLRAHLQAMTRSRGMFRLSNGTAVQLQ